MTKTLKIAVEELERRPEDVQERWGTLILEGLGISPKRAGENGERTVVPYSSLDVLMTTPVPGPPDASVSYEDELYGSEGDDR